MTCDRVQLPKYAPPSIHGSVARTGPPSWTITVALPIVSNPSCMSPPPPERCAASPAGQHRQRERAPEVARARAFTHGRGEKKGCDREGRPRKDGPSTPLRSAQGERSSRRLRRDARALRGALADERAGGGRDAGAVHAELRALLRRVTVRDEAVGQPEATHRDARGEPAALQ